MGGWSYIVVVVVVGGGGVYVRKLWVVIGLDKATLMNAKQTCLFKCVCVYFQCVCICVFMHSIHFHSIPFTSLPSVRMYGECTHVCLYRFVCECTSRACAGTLDR